VTTACLVCANIQGYFKGDRCSYCSYLRYSSYYLEINYIKVIPLGETPRIILAVHVIIVCNAMPGEHIHRCRTKYEVGAVHEAQSMKRASESHGSIVGHTRNSAVVVEWDWHSMRFCSYKTASVN